LDLTRAAVFVLLEEEVFFFFCRFFFLVFFYLPFSLRAEDGGGDYPLPVEEVFPLDSMFPSLSRVTFFFFVEKRCYPFLATTLPRKILT